MVVYRLAVAATLTGAFSLGNAGAQFLLISGGGIAVGFLMGWAFAWLLGRIDQAPVEVTISLVVPFATYVIADELLGVSGVLAVVSAGFYISRRLPNLNSSETQLQGSGFWNTLDFLFNNALFLLVGLQLRHIVGGLGELSLFQASFYALIVSTTLIATRMIWVFALALGPKLLVFRARGDDPFASWKEVMVVAWTGMRGAISLAGALALPLVLASGAAFPQRNLIVFITFTSILVTLVVQGLTLPPLLRRLQLKDEGETEREEIAARLEIARAALARLAQIEDGEQAPQPLIEHFQKVYRHRARGLESLNDRTQIDAFRDERQLCISIVQAQRASLAQIRARGALHEEAARRIQHDLDLEEQQLRNHERGDENDQR